MNLDVLNLRQREAVEHTEGPLLLLAGAGSGKTRTLAARAAYIIETKKLQPWNLLCVTFTNKAGKELRDRISTAVGRDVRGYTFHSLSAQILHENETILGYNRFTIYDTQDSLRLIRQCLKTLNMDEKYYTPRGVLDAISTAKNHYERPEEYFSQTLDFRKRQMVEVYSLYEKEQRRNNAIDFDNLQIKLVELFRTHPDVLRKYAERFHYIMVDEYQDTNHIQYQMIKMLSGVHENLCVVGDDDQSIYGWRGADIRNILEFEKDFPGAVIIRLEQNYRSTESILNAANRVIAYNIHRTGKTLFTEKGSGVPVVVYMADTERGESAYILAEITKLTSDYQYGEMAVLYRVTAQSRAIEEALMSAGIRYRVFGGRKFYDRREIKDVVALLRFLENDRDDLSLFSIINVPKRGIGEAAVAAIVEAAEHYDVPAYRIIQEAEEHFEQKRMRHNLVAFRERLEGILALKDRCSPYDFIKEAVDRSGMLAHYLEDGNEEAISRSENIKEFIGAAKEYFDDHPEADMTEFLQGMALTMDSDEIGDDSSSVTLTTLHSAKGLEFPVVFLVGMEEGLLPHSRAIEEENELEEERRLCYVGMTRAMDRLYLSHAESRYLFNQAKRNIPSRFLKELQGLPEHEMIYLSEGSVRQSVMEQSRPKREYRSVYDTTGTIVPAQATLRPAVISMAGEEEHFGLGDKVFHTLYKVGTVIAQKDGKLEIAFPGKGIKQIDTRYGVLKKV